MTIDAAALAQAKRRKAFGRTIRANHGRATFVRDSDLASRNAYRVAIGLPPVTSKPPRHRK